MTVEVWDWDMVGKNDFLGKVRISCFDGTVNFSTVNSLMSYFSFMVLYPCLFFLSSGGNPFCLFAQDSSVRGLVSFAALGKQ